MISENGYTMQPCSYLNEHKQVNMITFYREVNQIVKVKFKKKNNFVYKMPLYKIIKMKTINLYKKYIFIQIFPW